MKLFGTRANPTETLDFPNGSADARLPATAGVPVVGDISVISPITRPSIGVCLARPRDSDCRRTHAVHAVRSRQATGGDQTPSPRHPLSRLQGTADAVVLVAPLGVGRARINLPGYTPMNTPANKAQTTYRLFSAAPVERVELPTSGAPLGQPQSP